MVNTNSEFVMEVTDKTKADVKVIYPMILFVLAKTDLRWGRDINWLRRIDAAIRDSPSTHKPPWWFWVGSVVLNTVHINHLTLKSVRKFKIFNTNNLWINLKGVCNAYHRIAGVEISISLFLTSSETHHGQRGHEVRHHRRSQGHARRGTCHPGEVSLLNILLPSNDWPQIAWNSSWGRH